MFKLLLFICLFSIALAVPKHNQELERLRPGGPLTGPMGVKIEDFPYMLSMQFEGTHFCGAALISDTWAVTSASCFGAIHIDEIYVRANSTVWDDSETVAIKRAVINPNFGVSMDSDIALIELNTSLSCANCKPIALSKIALDSNDSVTLVRWATCYVGQIPYIELQAEQQLVNDRDVCAKNNTDAWGAKVSDNIFCAAGVNNSCIDVCYGQWGSPAVINGRLVGISSWAYECGQSGFVIVYTAISSFLDWIKDKSGISAQAMY